MLAAWTATAWSALPTPPNLADPQREYRTQVEQQDWDAALASAQQKLDAARAANAPPDKLAVALSQVGEAQLGKKDYSAAETTFTEALQLIEPISRGADARLIDPMRGLGFALAAQDKHAPAVSYMEKALALSRRSEGLFDLEQGGLLNELADSLSALGQPDAAEGHIKYLLRVGEHAYGEDDPRMVPLMCQVGDWYSERGLLTSARDLYRDALIIVEKKLGKKNVAAVLPLRSLADSYVREIFLSSYGIRAQDKFSMSPDPSSLGSDQGTPLNPRFLATDGERALRRALAILEANPTTRSNNAMIATLLQLGDWYQVKQQPDKALPYYERAASIVAADTQRAAAEKEAILGFPVQVYYPTPQLATRNLTRPPDEVVDRYVQVEFTVLPDGSVKNERVVDQDATQRQASQTLDAIHDARYRPKFVGGQPVPTEAVSYRQVFKQRKQEQDDAE